jgi:REP element-mobilizing transposase RayT
MAKRYVKFFKGRCYHIYNRGCNKDKIFFEENNYLYLLSKVKLYSSELSITVAAYCLMPNHYHFLLQQESDKPVNDFVKLVFNCYTKAINKRYTRSGTLFEGAFKAIYIEDGDYIKELCKYIHRNPLDCGLVKNLEDWKYSNYLEWIGKRNGSLFNRDFMNKYFISEEHYKKFVLEGY